MDAPGFQHLQLAAAARSVRCYCPAAAAASTATTAAFAASRRRPDRHGPGGRRRYWPYLGVACGGSKISPTMSFFSFPVSRFLFRGVGSTGNRREDKQAQQQQQYSQLQQQQQYSQQQQQYSQQQQQQQQYSQLQQQQQQYSQLHHQPEISSSSSKICFKDDCRDIEDCHQLEHWQHFGTGTGLVHLIPLLLLLYVSCNPDLCT
ncbi:hypothetical protein FHG87_022171 [Trinorchestia longiramus]|nr:hypothetical protein FHG87_022171 [Trinorchestia longiramus]